MDVEEMDYTYKSRTWTIVLMLALCSGIGIYRATKTSRALEDLKETERSHFNYAEEATLAFSCVSLTFSVIGLVITLATPPTTLPNKPTLALDSAGNAGASYGLVVQVQQQSLENVGKLAGKINELQEKLDQLNRRFNVSDEVLRDEMGKTIKILRKFNLEHGGGSTGGIATLDVCEDCISKKDLEVVK